MFHVKQDGGKGLLSRHAPIRCACCRAFIRISVNAAGVILRSAQLGPTCAVPRGRVSLQFSVPDRARMVRGGSKSSANGPIHRA